MESKYNKEQYRRRDEEKYNSEYEYDEPTRHQTRKQEEVPVDLWDLFLGTPKQKEVMWKVTKEEIVSSFESAKGFVPGFFAPFTSKKEFGVVATTPVTLPLAAGLVTCVAAVVAAGAALTALGSLVFAAGYGLDGLRKGHEESKEKSHAALIFAAKAGIIAAVCAVVTVAAALLTLITGPIALAYLTSRSIATGFAKASELISSCSSTDDHESTHSSYNPSSM
ncbi:hypothetical protein FOLKNPGA_03581 [Legionella sp. PC1000]|uniref:hypothetical protein n=1 Tax=Legionella sp. PC1000 TaxID=2746060 RepID=UPI0015FA6263|nr:hypothetical protein [Legionella sp. PC1000]QLZ70763.1 hypothetical protein FOLKNPGA_03581 [Legionella sp. PC1000]